MRAKLGAVLTLAVGLALTGCSSSPSNSASTSTATATATSAVSASDAATSSSASASSNVQASDALVFNHPSIDGLKIEFAEQPKNIVMDCYAYSTLDEYGIKPNAIFGYQCDDPTVMGGVDTTGIEQIGTDGEIDLEKLAQLKPDAIIGLGTADGWQWFKEDVNSQLTRVAQFVPLPGGDTVDEGIANVRELAEFLGADVTASHITKADQDYAAAKQNFSDAIAGEDLSFMLSSPTKEMLYTRADGPQADLLKSLGATLAGPTEGHEGSPWAWIAWEEASKYPTDVMLVENYDEADPFTAEMWDSLPSVQAGQLYAWNSKGALTSRHYADWLDGLATKVQGFNKVS
ncbi:MULTISPECIES: ABC transporter substrate-binding protein [unclassified Corynebacterium]|uniref:ABC transporter substrate-binding protein n=1 Tax=unclassified Corynebacterium TaxID=2624378 RepID=UPI0009F35F15|nr:MULTISPECIES: ABC transporter substrate-binding protein [unclassified Corynebacterium]